MAIRYGEQRGKRIALFVPGYLDDVHRLVHGIVERQAEQGGFHLKDYRFRLGDFDDRSQWPDTPPWKNQADGVIAYLGPKPGLADWVRKGGVPVVNMSADRVSGELPSVHDDGMSVAELACDHLLSLGYRSFTFVGYLSSPGADYRERMVAAALRDRGFSLKTCRVLARLENPDLQTASTLAADPRLKTFLRAQTKPLAVFCQNDQYGVGVCAAARQARLRVPEDVGVIGVGDLAISRESDPSLSSVRLPAEQIGYRAMDLLSRLLNGQAEPQEPIELPATEVVPRGSTCRNLPRHKDLERAMQMIRDRACEGIDVGDVLETLGISRKTFERRFVDAIGHPPGEELRRIRLARAEQLLATTDLTVTRIGCMVGFPRPSMFARFFKTRSGQTPREFRRQSVRSEFRNRGSVSQS